MTSFKKISMVVLIVAMSCNNPFATRNPEEPTEDRYTWLQPTIPERVLDNLKFSLIEANTNNYVECLTDTVSRFHFTPDPFVGRNYPELFKSWDLTRELTYITEVFSATTDSTIEVEFSRIESIDDLDSVLIKIDYKLKIPHNDASFPKEFEGQANFWLNSSRGEWYITSWKDFGTADKYSWSSIKARFAQ